MNVRRRSENGFTLIEVCIVTLISGLLFISLYELYTRYAKQAEVDTTWDHLQLSSNKIGDFFAAWRRYPCPADRTLKPGDLNWGKEIDPTAFGTTGADGTGVCDLGPTGLNLIPSPIPGGWLGACYTTGVGVVPNAGTNGVGGVCAFLDQSLANVVVIGAVPIDTLTVGAGHDSYGTSIIYDGWGNQLDYVVTYRLTGTGTYRYDRGAITVHDENGRDTAGIVNNGHYGLISHGQDGIGAYTRNGQMFQVCGSHVPQSWNTGDDENCSNKPIFIAGIKNSSRTVFHYDDMVYFVNKSAGGLWAQLNGSSDMLNTNPGMVNVGTDGITQPPSTANVALNVGDPLSANNGVLRAANNAKMAQVCKKDGTNCFAVTNVVTTNCNAGEVMYGFSNGSKTCAAPSFNMPAPNQTCCPAVGTCDGHWMTGITSQGIITCN